MTTEATAVVAQRDTKDRGTSDRGIPPRVPPAQRVTRISFRRGSTVRGDLPVPPVKPHPTNVLAEKPANFESRAVPSQVDRGLPPPAAPGAIVRVPPKIQEPSTGVNSATPAKATSPRAKNLPSQSVAPKAEQPSKSEDDQLRALATKIGDLLYYQRPGWNSDEELAPIALSLLRRTLQNPLDGRQLRRMLHFLPQDIRALFFRLARAPEMADYLTGIGFSWDEILTEDQPTASDWLSFANGSLGGIAFGVFENDLALVLLPKDIAQAVYVSVGRFWDPKLAETYDQFTTALGQLLRHPILSADAILGAKVAEIRKELAHRHFRKAGFLFGQVGPEIFFAVKGAKDLGKLAVKLAKTLPRIAVKTIRDARMLTAFARFYLSTAIREILTDGTRLEKMEHSLVVTTKAGTSGVFDVSELTTSEQQEWSHAIESEKRGTAIEPGPDEPGPIPSSRPSASGVPTGEERLVRRPGEPVGTPSRTDRAANPKSSARSSADSLADRGTTNKNVPKDSVFEPPELKSSTVNLSGETAGTGGIKRISAIRSSDGTLTFTIVGDVKKPIWPRSGAPNYNQKGISAALAGLPEYDVAHLWGPGLGDEARDGLMYAPRDINRRFQAEVESRIRELQTLAAKQGATIELVAEAESYPVRTWKGHTLLKESNYEFTVRLANGDLLDVGKVSITVGPPGSGRYGLEVTGGSAGVWSLK